MLLTTNSFEIVWVLQGVVEVASLFSIPLLLSENLHCDRHSKNTQVSQQFVRLQRINNITPPPV